jgi:hypothetical protein
VHGILLPATCLLTAYFFTAYRAPQTAYCALSLPVLSHLHDFLLQAPTASRWLTDSVSVFQPRLHPAEPGGIWIHALLFLSFTMIVVLRVFDFRRLVALVQGFLRASSVNVVYREESALSSRVSLFLILNFLMMASLFIWQLFGVLFTNYPPPSAILWIGLIILGIYLVKIIGIRILGFIFEMKEAAQEYIYNVVLFNKTVGLILFPVTLCLAYARQLPPIWLIYGGLTAWAIILIYRFVRLSWIGISERGVSFLYIILYLCTLEILPFVVIIKVLIRFS